MARVALLVVVLAAAAAASAWWVERSETPPFERGAPARTPPTEESLGPGLHLAGSGSNLVLTRALAAAYRRASADEHLVVHDSIGSTGGVRAVADGAIPIGLIARPLNERERALGLTVIPYARAPIVLLAHPDVRDAGLTAAELVASLRGERDAWDDGTPLVWLLRERGDAGTAVLGRAIPGLTSAVEEALESRRFRVVYHDEDLSRGVLGVRGALGISDLPQALASAPTAQVLSLDGVAPSAASTRDGTYPLYKDLCFVVREPLGASEARFLAFVASHEGRQVIEELGALALPVTSRPDESSSAAALEGAR